jgi:starch phosphorylase
LTPDSPRIRGTGFVEVGLDSALPTYSGGLGILAGDTLRAAADLGLPPPSVHRKSSID